MKALFLTGCFACIGSLALAASNEDHCAAAQAADKLDGATKEQCLCAYGKADTHLTPDMKQIMMESHLTGESPMNKMMTLGDLESLMPKMMAYGEAIEKECGL
jgi:hypothetical protein